MFPIRYAGPLLVFMTVYGAKADNWQRDYSRSCKINRGTCRPFNPYAKKGE